MNEVVVKPNLSDISKTLYELLEQKDIVYLTWKPEIIDFRSANKINLLVCTKDSYVKIPLLREHIASFAGILGASLFSASKVVMCWDIKQLFSYFRYHLPRHFRFPACCRFLDLKLLESYLDVPGSKPTSYAEATDRLRPLMTDQLLRINTEIYTPLACEIIPSIETAGLVNTETKRIDYSHYNIEGSLNGRLSANEAFDGCFLPMNMTVEQKKKYQPGLEKVFLVFDYKSCEVVVLQWLTKDRRLGALIESGKDVYEWIYNLIEGKKACTESSRTLIKNIFLPVVYGMGNELLSKRGNISLNGAKYLKEKLIELFPDVFDWIRAWEDKVKVDPIITDCFGRKFNFAEGNRPANGVRNAVVQSPAALVCLEKLIKLYQERCASMEVVATVHDAYVCTADRSLIQPVASHAKEILESPSEFASGLNLKVKISLGDNWGELKELQLE